MPTRPLWLSSLASLLFTGCVCTGFMLNGAASARVDPPADPPTKSTKLLDELLIPSDKVRRDEPDPDGQKPIVAVVVPHNNIFPALVIAQAGMEERDQDDGGAEAGADAQFGRSLRRAGRGRGRTGGQHAGAGGGELPVDHDRQPL
jgi:hypothetical protein